MYILVSKRKERQRGRWRSRRKGGGGRRKEGERLILLINLHFRVYYMFTQDEAIKFNVAWKTL